jgi:hypothetical protein
VIKTEMEARTAEIEVLALATGTASRLVATDREVLRTMRHADDEVAVAKNAAGKKVASIDRGRAV